MIKTIWFDLGNVILYFDFEPALKKILKYSKLNIGQIRDYFRHNIQLEEDLDRGFINARCLFGILRKDLELSGLSFNRFKNIWNNIFTKNSEIMSLIPKLKKAGYRLLLLSNTNRLHYDYIAKKYSVVHAFDKHVLSYNLGCRKPDSKIFKEAINQSSAGPNEIFYIDDKKEFTYTAMRFHRIKSHTYGTTSQLMREFKKHNIQAA